MKNDSFTFKVLPFFIILFLSCTQKKQGLQSNYISFETTDELYDFFRYKNDSTIIVSGHRGGRKNNFPENCIEGFQNVLNHMPAIFEIDPRLTKDSVIVLMHDESLDRTTDTSGLLKDYNWKELKEVCLKDYDGNITPYHIPTLEDVIKWSKEKTIINLDKKDVPMEMIVEIIKKHRAEKNVMLTVHNATQARYYNDRIPEIMLSVFVRNEKEFEDISHSGVNWSNMIAYVGKTINDQNIDIVKKLRAKGVRCMVSYAPTIDKIENSKERVQAYQEEVLKYPDIIESDIPMEVWRILQTQGILQKNLKNE